MAKNKVEFGLSNVHIAVEQDGGGWGTPRHIPGAVSWTPDAEGEEYHFYADDLDYFSETSDNGYTGDLTMALLPEWFLADVLGYKQLVDGGVVEIRNSVKRRICLIFEGKGDRHKTRRVYINCSAGKPSEEFQTIEEGKEVRVQVIPLIVTGDTKTGVTTIKYNEEDAGYEKVLTQVPDLSSISDIDTSEEVQEV